MWLLYLLFYQYSKESPTLSGASSTSDSFKNISVICQTRNLLNFGCSLPIVFHLNIHIETSLWVCLFGAYSFSFSCSVQMLLMSGLSHNSWEELSSERKYEDRIPHLCNMLRFAFLKEGSSFMAIGGSWDTIDGNDPSVDRSALVRTVLRLVLVWSIVLILFVLLLLLIYLYLGMLRSWQGLTWRTADIGIHFLR